MNFGQWKSKKVDAIQTIIQKLEKNICEADLLFETEYHQYISEYKYRNLKKQNAKTILKKSLYDHVEQKSNSLRSNEKLHLLFCKLY